MNTFHNIGTGIENLSGETINVKTYKISEIVKDRKIDLIRMDVEGHEVEVLNGLVSSVNEFKQLPKIIFETHISRYGENHNFRETLEKLFNIGYKINMVGSSSESGSVKLKKLGYHSIKNIKSDGDIRGIFKNIKESDAIDLICNKGGIRTVLLSPM